MKLPLLQSLRFRMPLIVWLGVSPLICLAIWYDSSRATQIIHQDTQENLALKAQVLADSVSRWEEMQVLALDNLSRQPAIASMNAQQQKPVLTSMVKTYQNLYLASTINLDGWNVARSDGKKPNYYGDQPWFLEAKAGNDIIYQTLISPTTNQPGLCLSAPIRREKLETLGVARLCTDLKVLAEQIGTARFGQTGFAFVVDDRGQVLAHPNLEFISGEQLTVDQHPAVKAILSGNSGPFSFADEQGVKWLSYGTLLDNGWGILFLQQEAEVLKDEREFQHLAMAIASVAVLGAGALTWFLANRLIQPIDSLTRAVTGIANGQLNQKLAIERQDELGILAQSFNQMSVQLQESFEAKETSETANQAKGEFLAHMSHELRTYLSSILGYAKILQRERQILRQIEGLKIIEQSGKQMLTLINDILDFSKTEASKMELRPSDLHFSTFLEGIVGIVKLRVLEKGILFHYEAQDNLATGIRADEKQLRQVFLNLLDNALKFTDQGKVTLRVSVIDRVKASSATSQPQQTIRFEVIDTGVGISPQQLKKIFQPFEQVGAPERQASGTGLGLAISRQLVKLMGGELKVKSELGKGTTFWFDLTFPVVKVVAQVPQEQAAQVVGYKGKRRKLLVVDDQVEHRSLLLNMLECLGFEVITAENGKRGLEITYKILPDLILTDLFMGSISGFGMVQELRQKEEFKDVPIIAATASTFEGVEKELRRVGCNAFLRKPIDEKQLMALLEQYLQLEWIYE